MPKQKRRHSRQLTSRGKEIKMRLLELNMTQAEFCRRYYIPQNRFCDILHTEDERRFWAMRRRIYEILKLSA